MAFIRNSVVINIHKVRQNFENITNKALVQYFRFGKTEALNKYNAFDNKVDYFFPMNSSKV